MCTISIEIFIGLLTAAKLSKGIRGTKLASLAITTPMMIAPVAAASCWLWMFSDGYGIINHFLSYLGIEGPLWLTYATGSALGRGNCKCVGSRAFCHFAFVRSADQYFAGSV